MGRKIRERIIRRLGGVPCNLYVRDPLPDHYLQLMEARIEQDMSGCTITVKYMAVQYEKKKKEGRK